MDRNNKKRYFIALNLNPKAREQIAAAINDWQKKQHGIKWVKPDSYHLTLHFLGSLDETALEKVRKAVQSFDNRFNIFSFKTGKISAWPSWRQPRVIFLESRPQNGNSIFKLQTLLGKKISELGVELDAKAWQPHITLGRLKDGETPAIDFDFKPSEIEDSIDSFDLMESELFPSGPRYKVIEKYSLH